jgi:hypothetical protein
MQMKRTTDLEKSTDLMAGLYWLVGGRLAAFDRRTITIQAVLEMKRWSHIDKGGAVKRAIY